jgi:hypothetical protein
MTTRVPVKLIRNGAAPEGNVNDDALRNGGRTWLGDWTTFNGDFGGYDDLTGISPLTRALHNWAPREATVGVDSHWGSMTIVGSSQASKQVNWPAFGTGPIAPSIGVSGFAINDYNGGTVWGGYFDCVRMPGVDGFNVAAEFTVANFGANSFASPFNLIDGSVKSGAMLWTQSGAGMSLIPSDLAQIGLDVEDVNHTSAIAAFLPMQQLALSYPNWANSTAYVVGNIRTDPVSDTIWRCIEAHTSPGSGTFAAARAANPARWKQNPASLSGIIFGAGCLAERTAGSNYFSAIEFTENMAMTWFRKTSAGAVEQAGVFFAENMPDGTPVTQLILRAYAVFTNMVYAGTADGTTGALIQGRDAGGGDAFSFRKNGSAVEIYVNNVLVKTL